MNNITHASFPTLSTSVRLLGDLYSLNDLHKASGGKEKHSPRHWSRLQQTKALIGEIEKEQICAIQSKQGLGTFVCKELVCDYAAWIDAAFHLKIIRTFLSSNSSKETSNSTKTTPDERSGLRQAVTMLTTKKGLLHGEAYKMVHQKFNITAIEDLSKEQLDDAIEYVHKLALDGEYLPKDTPDWETQEYKDKHRKCAVALMTAGHEMKIRQDKIMRRMDAKMDEMRELLRQAQRCSGLIHD